MPFLLYISSLAFFMMGGAAMQNINLYLFGILLPMLFVYQKKCAAHLTRFPGSIVGLALIAMYLIFIVTNITGYVLMSDAIAKANAAAITSFKFKKIIIESRLSSMCFFSGIVLVLSRVLAKRASAAPNFSFRHTQVFLAFTYALSLASVILMIYVVIQHLSGFDYNAANFSLDHRKLMGQNQYRALGFFSHPLSLAGACLAITSFYLAVWRGCFFLKSDHILFKKGARKKIFSAFAIIAVCHSICIVLSGARIAAALMVVAYLIFFLNLPRVSQKFSLKFWLILALFILTPSLFVLSGMQNRVWEIINAFKDGSVSDQRLYFWQLHWRIFTLHPILGQGHALLQGFLREYYYQLFGWGGLPQHYNAHNIYLEVLADAGLIGFTVLAVSIFAIQKAFKKIAATNSFLGVLYSGFAIAVIANALHGFTQNVFFDSSVFYVYCTLFWLLFWCVVTCNANE